MRWPRKGPLGDPLLTEYDPNNDGVIEKVDMRRAVANFFRVIADVEQGGYAAIGWQLLQPVRGEQAPFVLGSRQDGTNVCPAVTAASKPAKIGMAMKRELKLALVVGIVVALGLMGLMPAAAQQTDPTVTRSINPGSVPAGGGVVTVTISINGNYGIGSVVERLPADFSYVPGSVTPSDITTEIAGQNATFSLVGESSFSYRVNTSSSSGDHRFPSGSQLTYGVDKDTAPVRGESMVTVEQAQESSVTVTRSINPGSVPAGGGVVTVTISINGNYGIGSVVEKLPADFSYVPGSVTPSDITTEIAGQNATFSLVGESSFSYRVNTSSSSGDHRFPSGSQLTYGVDKDTAPVRGESMVTVEQAQESSVTVTRSINPGSVPAGGGVVTVTISINGNYGIGSVVERLPADFSYVPGSVTPSDITTEIAGQNATFSLVGESSFSYRVNTSSSSGDHRFPSGSQLTYGVDKDTAPVRGESSVTVRVVAPEPEPQVNRDPTFPGSSTTRSINENSVSGANVGSAVRASDADGDRLTYSLTGTDAGSFTINGSTGQIMVGAGTTLDYETKASYMVTVAATDPDSDSDSIMVTIMVTNVNEMGMVELSSMTPMVGVDLTATLTDPDVVVEGSVTWQWTRSMSMYGTFENIDGATFDAYTPTADDVGYYLRATVMYTDGHGSGKDAMETTTAAVVTTGDPLVARYDANGNGEIEKSEVIKAINDYLFGTGDGTPAPSKAEVIRLINLYLFG